MPITPQPTGSYQQNVANSIRLVQVIQEEEGNPGSFPNVITPCVYKCMPATVTYESVEGSGVGIQVSTDDDRAIYIANFRQNNPILGAYYLVFRLNNGSYVFDNQMAFLENQ